MKIIKPNTVLPKGGRLIKVVKKKFASWVAMEYDAQVERFGITWFRVKGGMGRGQDREDWVADIPGVCVSIHDYQWREPRWGFDKYQSFDEAVIGQMKLGLTCALDDLKKHQAAVSVTTEAVSILSNAIPEE